MKRALICFAAAALMLGSCAPDRSQVLKVYNWSDYIDESVIPEFEQWYEEQTGEKVTVIYQTFDINETMLSKIEKGHEDYDAVSPSDYIIERMMHEDLLIPIERDFGETPNYIDSTWSPFVRECFNKVAVDGKTANEYAVGNMWGTTGILYNAKFVADEDALTWDIIKNPKYKGHILVKDSARDVYSQIILKIHEEDIAAGRISADELMNYTSDEDIAAVEAYLVECRDLVAGWEADFGKDQIAQETAWLGLTWSGDAMWAIQESEGVDLRYALPREGFAVWFDGWVIPKYAKNVKAARYWINFMCRPDIAIRNQQVSGYVTANGSPEVLAEFVDTTYAPVDLTYFFGAGYDSVRVNPILYPDKADIDRAVMEHDWGENTTKLIEMWGRVNGDNANIITYVIIAVALLAGIAAVVMTNASKKRRHASRRRRR